MQNDVKSCKIMQNSKKANAAGGANATDTIYFYFAISSPRGPQN